MPDLQTLSLAFLAMVSVGGLAYVFIYPHLSGDIRGEKRQKALSEAKSIRTAVSEKTSQANRRDQVAQSLKELEQRQVSKKISLETRIAQAGLETSKIKFIIICIFTGLIFSFGTYVATANLALTAGAVFTGSLGLPLWILAFLKKRRLEKFITEFPNAMDVIVRGVKAGLPLGDCLRIIANEAAEPVRSEFKYIQECQSIGLPLNEALEKMYERVPVSEANFFGIVIAIQTKAGGNLSEALANLSRVLRERKRMKGKIIAMSMEAKASAAIIASLPVIVMIMLGFSTPGYVVLLWTAETGKIALAASAFWMFVGIMVMRKMIHFDI